MALSARPGAPEHGTEVIASRLTRAAVTTALAGFALTAAALTGCGLNPSPSQTANLALPTSIDPCTLLTDEQASALNVVTYKSGAAEPPIGGLSMCSWDNAAARATVEIGFAFWPSATAAQAAYDAAVTRASPPGSAVTPVAGPADGAVIARQTPTQTVIGTGAIVVRRGALLITVGYYNGTPPTDEALKAAAAFVLSELPQFAR